MNKSSNHGPSVPTIGRRFKSKPVMIITAIVAIIVLIIFLSSASNGDKQASETIRKFQNAIAAEDTQALKKLLSVDDSQVEVTEDRLRRLIRYMKEEPNYYEETLQVMAGQQALLEEAEYLNTGLLDNMSPEQLLNLGEMYLKKESGFLSDTFKIGVRPQYANITLENDNGTIAVDGKEVLKVSKDNHSAKVGPLFPGEYQVDFTTSFDYVKQEIKKSETVSLFGLEPETDYSDFVTGDGVKIRSDLGEVQVYVNDQPTPLVHRSRMDNKESSDIFYPAFSDGSQKIQGVAKFPWGESKSEPLVIDDLSSEYDITPKLKEETVREVLKFVNLFLETRAKAFGSNDMSELKKMYVPDPEGDLIEEVENGLNDLYYAGGSDRTLTGVELLKIWYVGAEDPLGHVSVHYNVDLSKYVISVSNLSPYYKLTLSDGDTDDIDNSEYFSLQLEYIDEQWKVTHIY
ncbi:hypothetical protein MUG84_23925 [Paenibacillus sp. KQZ6P-2]|uniref:Uncharacterized protein n=1 Tax=Paenibacillus mangrovi TaxID=2931978 RepID=A0A9X1WYX8_9BACL|nr:hypothetical protein [Paenibacillus mangrovi]MCJ8014734.1 hypothetical protein [Paenibacillus mangrovi]